MFRVRRSKLTLLASAVGATLPAWGFAQNSATWSFSGPAANGGPWTANWTDTTSVKPWAPNTTYPNSATANPIFPGANVNSSSADTGSIVLNVSGILINSLNFYGNGTNNLSSPADVNKIGYRVAGSGGITIIPSGSNNGTIDVSNIGRDNTGILGIATPYTLPGMATISVNITQSAGQLYKTGTGTLVLDGTNSDFTGMGGIQVNQGVLRITNSGALNNLSAIGTGTNAAIELYNNANNFKPAGAAVLYTGLGAIASAALPLANGGGVIGPDNGELAAMPTITAGNTFGSTSTWGDANSLTYIYGNPSFGAGSQSTLTVGGTILDLGTNGLTKVGVGTVITPGLQLGGGVGGSPNAALRINAGLHRIAALSGNSNANTSYVHGLTIAGGGTPTAALDLTSNDMVVDYTGSSSPFALIRAQIIAGRNGGAWTGKGITSSSIPTSGDGAGGPGPGNDPSERGLTTALGYAENADLGRTTLGGVSVPSTSVLIKYTFPGDANLDGSVDGADATTWATHFTGSLGPGGTSRWQDGDWNYDGSVDGADITLWATHFTGSLGVGGLGPIILPGDTNPEAVGLLEGLGLNVAIPEPTVMGGVALGLATLVSRRRRRS